MNEYVFGKEVSGRVTYVKELVPLEETKNIEQAHSYVERRKAELDYVKYSLFSKGYLVLTLSRRDYV